MAYIEALENVLKQILDIQEKQAKELREAHRQATPFRRNKNKDKRDRKKKKAGRKGGHSQQKRSAPDEVDEQHDAPPLPS